MRIIISILIIFLSIKPLYATVKVQEYIDSFEDTFAPQCSEVFSQLIKGSAIISDLEKQMIIDEEISKELNSDFVYTDLETCLKLALKENYDIKINSAYKRQYYWLYRNAQFQLLPNIYYNYDIKKTR